MFKIIGSLLILVSCVLIGNNLSKKSELTMRTTEALITFVSYVGTSIKTMRIPLKKIYSDFENTTLEKNGFIKVLKNVGLSEAVKLIECILTPESLNAMNYLHCNLGGIDINDQCNLCTYVENKLKDELENIKSTYNEKKRMYQILPILCGISVIILIV